MPRGCFRRDGFSVSGRASGARGRGTSGGGVRVQVLAVVHTMDARARKNPLLLSDKGVEVLRKMLSVGVYEYLGCEQPSCAGARELDTHQPPTWRRSSAKAALHAGLTVCAPCHTHASPAEACEFVVRVQATAPSVCAGADVPSA